MLGLVMFSRGRSYMYSISWKLYRKLQMNGWLTCSSIRRSRMMFRTLSDRTTGNEQVSKRRECEWDRWLRSYEEPALSITYLHPCECI